jgi:uncharacterized protein
MSTPPDPLSILLISDGRPGHFNLAEGIVAAVARLRPVDVNRLEVKRPAWLPARVLSTLVNHGMAPERILGWLYGVDPGGLGHVDLIVSAGGNTLAANIAAAEITGAANVFYGSLRRYGAEDFALVMSSYAGPADEPNQVMTLKPSKLDPDELGVIADDSHETARRLGLIIGGNSGTVRFVEADWDRLLGFVRSSGSSGVNWIVANAPRTPEAVSDRLAEMAAADNSPIEQFIDVRTAGSGTLGILLSRAEAVVCTADSSTMLSETVWMRRPVVAVSPKAFSLPENEADYRAWLSKKGWTRQMSIQELAPETLETALDEIVVLDSNPMDGLAALLEERLPQLFS